MDFDFTSEQAALRDSIRRYLKHEISPRITEGEQARCIPQDVLKGLQPFGYIGGQLPEASGGFDLDYITWGLMIEEAGYCWGSLRTIINITNTFLRLVSDLGTPEQKQQFLQGALDSSKRVCLALSEPNHGSNIAGVECRADDRGDHYVLNGNKLWITNGHNADYALVLARTHSASCAGKLSLFLVDREASPFTSQLVDKMVLKASGTSELTFSDVRLPKTALLGTEGAGLKEMLKGLSYGRLNIAMGAVGAAQAALDMSIEYARTRKQFGRVIGEFQLIQKHIVDMLMRTEAARGLAYKAAATVQAGKPSRVECSVAKLYATEAAHEVARLALNLHGGIGYSTEYGLERIFRDTSGGLIPEGTAEMQTLMIGREVLGLSAIHAQENKA